MLNEWKYYFYDSNSNKIIEKLLNQKSQGLFLGFTFDNARTHSCFNEEQCISIEKIIKTDFNNLEFQKIHYYRGNLLDEDTGFKTFKEPYIQWCPSPVFSYKSCNMIPPEEPWGISMEGHVLLHSSLRLTLLKEVSGLKLLKMNCIDGFDIYEVDKVEVTEVHITNDDNPLYLDYSIKGDIFLLNNKYYICSNRFAKLLKKYWKGLSFNKFQPVICKNIDNALKRDLLKKITLTQNTEIQKKLSDDINTLELIFGVVFPKDYILWVLDLEGNLPNGWLSPLGCKKSELYDTYIQERTLSDPAIDKNMVPLFRIGDGNFICLFKSEIILWDHETSNSSIIKMPCGLADWLNNQ